MEWLLYDKYLLFLLFCLNMNIKERHCILSFNLLSKEVNEDWMNFSLRDYRFMVWNTLSSTNE